MSVALGLATGVALVFWLILERRRPAFSQRGGRGRLWKNAGLGGIGLLTTFLVVTPLSVLAAEIGPAWRDGWPFALRFLTDLLLLEFFIYWWHRANHEIPALWRFHRVHHYDEFLDATSALRFHPGELVLSAVVRGLFVGLLDVSIAAILVFDALVVAAAAFHHSNLAISGSLEHRLRPFLVTPGHHRIHHIPERAFTDSNYGTLSTIWDRLFGTWREHERHGVYGVEHQHDRSLFDLLTDPARPSVPGR